MGSCSRTGRHTEKNISWHPKERRPQRLFCSPHRLQQDFPARLKRARQVSRLRPSYSRISLRSVTWRMPPLRLHNDPPPTRSKKGASKCRLSARLLASASPQCLCGEALFVGSFPRVIICLTLSPAIRLLLALIMGRRRRNKAHTDVTRPELIPVVC